MINPVSRTSSVLIFYLACIIVGCGSESPGTGPGQTSVLEITTNATRYSAGSSGTVLARNKADVEALVDLCPWELDRRTDGWRVIAIWPDSGGTCLPILTVLRPGQSALRPFELPPDLPSGEYRLRFERLFDSDTQKLPLPERVSRSFRVDQ